MAKFNAPAQRKITGMLRKITQKNNEEAGTGDSVPENAAVTNSEGASNKTKACETSHGPRGILRNFLMYLAALIYFELVTRIDAGIKPAISIYPLLFLPAMAMFLALISGWKKGFADKIAGLAILVLLIVYYGSQVVYHRIFGSFYSFSMIGVGGAAITNFAWAMGEVMLSSIGVILLLCVPVIIYAAAWIFKKLPVVSGGVWWHLACAAACALLWIAAVCLLPLGGKEQFSAYYAYHSDYIDTDSSVGRLGALTTSVIEAMQPVFGSSGQEDTFTLGTTDTPTLQDGDSSQPDATAESDETATENGDNGDSVEPVPEEEPAEEVNPYNTYPDIDFNALEAATDNSTIKTLCQYFAQVQGTTKNEMTGYLEGYNLIYICAEAFCSAAIDPDVTPTLYKMANNGIVLDNFYNSFINTTTNGEFALMSGLWPDMSRKAADCGSLNGTFNKTIDNYMPYGLGNIFSLHGVRSLGYHGYLGEYYNREGTHPNLGYKMKFRDVVNGGLTFTTRWPSSDLELMEQTVGDYASDERFNVYYMTFSGHGPYTGENVIAARNLTETKERLGDKYKDYPSQALYYLAANMELDKAMEYLLEELEKAGTLDKTLIVICGDHYPYYLKEKSFAYLMGYEEMSTGDKYKSTCIMYTSGIAEPIHCDSYCCNVDILPTVLNLLGFEYDSRMLAGTDVFADTTHAAVLYNQNFITEYVEYFATDGEINWLPAADGFTEEDKQEYLDYMTSLTQSRYSFSLEIVNTDFYRYVWSNTEWTCPIAPDGYSEAVEEETAQP